MVYEMKIVFWNVNSDRRAELRDQTPYRYTALAFPEYNIAERFPKIASSLNQMAKEQGIAIFALQEVEDSILPELRKFLSYLGYNVITHKYNPTGMAFNFVFAYKQNEYELLNSRQLYLTQSRQSLANRNIPADQIKEHNFGVIFERSVQVVDLKHLATAKSYTIVNIHFDIPNAHKLLAAQYLCDQFSNPNSQLIIGGDGNQFDAMVTEPKLFDDQINVFKKNGFQWIGESLLKKEPKKTFAPFAHDINRFLGKAERDQYESLQKSDDYQGIRALFLKTINEKPECLDSTVLDTVFTKNIAPNTEISAKALMFDYNGKRIKLDAAGYNTFLIDCYKHNTCPPSDHLPVLVKLKC
jgi:endonuclease/exonuclease/phosphatase family metal-dependent hydrolase